MFLFFKPLLSNSGGGGFDGGGIANGYVVRTDKKEQSKKRLGKKRDGKVIKPAPSAVEIINLAEDKRIEELKRQLKTLSTEVEIKVLKSAEAVVVAQLQAEITRHAAEAKATAEQGRKRYVLEIFSKLLEDAERQLAAEQAEVLEILDIMDDHAMRALDVHALITRKGR